MNNANNEISMNDEEKEEREPYPTQEGKLKDDHVIVEEGADEVYEHGYYGSFDEDRKLMLSPVESLLLLERGRLNITADDETDAFTFDEILTYFLKNDPQIWTRYLVYRDLRSRGYIVRSGLGDPIHYRIYPRGGVIGKDEAAYLVCIVVEGTPFKLDVLDSVTRQARNVRKKLVLAVVDNVGEVTYYLGTQVNLAVKKQISDITGKGYIQKS
ncbi:MAG: tRNA-intron lyase [Candidatus Sifarchaeia archaeon]